MYNLNEKRLIKTFTELAHIASPSWNEKGVIDYIIKKLKKINISVKKIKCASSYNLYIDLKNNKYSTPLLFAAHMDTVTPCEKIKVIEKSDRLCSDGTTILGADDKAGVAAIIEMIYFIKENKLSHHSLEIIFSCAEEVGLCGIKNFNFSKLKAKSGIVVDGDGPIGTATLQAPYHTTFHIEITGKAAHAGVEPEKGISAITVLAEIINSFPKGRLDKETTLNVGIISGGKANNIVAEKAALDMEARSLNNIKLKRLEQKVITIAREKAKKHKTKIKIDKQREYNGYLIKKSDPLIKLFEKAASHINLKPIYEASGGGSDTNIINANKIKALNISIGMTNVHTTKEYLKKKDLIAGTKLLIALAENRD